MKLQAVTAGRRAATVCKARVSGAVELHTEWCHGSTNVAGMSFGFL